MGIMGGHQTACELRLNYRGIFFMGYNKLPQLLLLIMHLFFNVTWKLCGSIRNVKKRWKLGFLQKVGGLIQRTEQCE